MFISSIEVQQVALTLRSLTEACEKKQQKNKSWMVPLPSSSTNKKMPDFQRKRPRFELKQKFPVEKSSGEELMMDEQSVPLQVQNGLIKNVIIINEEVSDSIPALVRSNSDSTAGDSASGGDLDGTVECDTNIQDSISDSMDPLSSTLQLDVVHRHEPSIVHADPTLIDLVSKVPVFKSQRIYQNLKPLMALEEALVNKKNNFELVVADQLQTNLLLSSPTIACKPSLSIDYCIEPLSASLRIKFSLLSANFTDRIDFLVTLPASGSTEVNGLLSNTVLSRKPRMKLIKMNGTIDDAERKLLKIDPLSSWLEPFIKPTKLFKNDGPVFVNMDPLSVALANANMLFSAPSATPSSKHQLVHLPSRIDHGRIPKSQKALITLQAFENCNKISLMNDRLQVDFKLLCPVVDLKACDGDDNVAQEQTFSITDEDAVVSTTENKKDKDTTAVEETCSIETENDGPGMANEKENDAILEEGNLIQTKDDDCDNILEQGTDASANKENDMVLGKNETVGSGKSTDKNVGESQNRKPDDSSTKTNENGAPLSVLESKKAALDVENQPDVANEPHVNVQIDNAAEHTSDKENVPGAETKKEDAKSAISSANASNKTKHPENSGILEEIQTLQAIRQRNNAVNSSTENGPLLPRPKESYEQEAERLMKQEEERRRAQKLEKAASSSTYFQRAMLAVVELTAEGLVGCCLKKERDDADNDEYYEHEKED